MQSGRFAQKVLAAIRAQCEDLALYRYMMRKLCSAAVMQFKTLAAHMDRYVANAERAARWLQARCRLRLRDILLGIVDAG